MAAGDSLRVPGYAVAQRVADAIDAIAGGSYTNEEAQDAVGTILVDSSSIVLTYDDALPSITADLTTNFKLNTIGLVIDGGGSAITTGVKGYVRVPYDCTVTAWDLVADQSGSIVIDVWKDTYANYPPTVADTIAGTEKPTLSAAIKNQDTSLSTWTTTLAEGDYLGFNVDSAATVQRVTLQLRVTRT